MNRQEFESRATRPINDSDYQKVEYVYTYHPCIDPNKGKDQIGALYSEFGMRIIEDMLPTAKRAEEIEVEMGQCRKRLDRIRAEYETLKCGN